jgi:hypothetical protein
MPDNKMNNPEYGKNLGGKTGSESQQGQQAPGRKMPDDQSAGQRGGDRGTERKGQVEMDQGGQGQGTPLQFALLDPFQTSVAANRLTQTAAYAFSFRKHVQKVLAQNLANVPLAIAAPQKFIGDIRQH